MYAPKRSERENLPPAAATLVYRCVHQHRKPFPGFVLTGCVLALLIGRSNYSHVFHLAQIKSNKTKISSKKERQRSRVLLWWGKGCKPFLPLHLHACWCVLYYLGQSQCLPIWSTVQVVIECWPYAASPSGQMGGITNPVLLIA